MAVFYQSNFKNKEDYTYKLLLRAEHYDIEYDTSNIDFEKLERDLAECEKVETEAISLGLAKPMFFCLEDVKSDIKFMREKLAKIEASLRFSEGEDEYTESRREQKWNNRSYYDNIKCW